MNDTEIDTLIVNAIKNNKIAKQKPQTEPKPSSIKIYKEQLKKLYSIVNTETDITMNGISKIITNFIDIKKMLDKSESDYSDNTKKNYINNVLNIILYITDIDKYHKLKSAKLDKITQAITEYWTELVDRVNNKNLENTKNEATHIESEEFTKVIKNMRKNIDKSEIDKNTLQDFILLLLYEGKYIPPLRNNYATLHITEPQNSFLSSENYLICKDGKNEILINSDKVDKKMGSAKYKINKSSILNKYLNKLLEIRKSEDKDYLLENADGERMSCNSLTKHLQKIFKLHFNKKLSSSNLRHIYISNLSPTLTNKKLDKIATSMRHSLTTQQQIYKKV